MLHLLENLLFCILSGIILFFFLLILYYQYAFNYWKRKGIPYIKPSFPLGNMSPNFSKTIGQTIASIYHEMKKQGHTYCGYYLFASPIFMPISPEMNKYLLTTNFNCFADRGFASDEKNDPMGSSLITWHGEKWKRMREKLSPAWSAGKNKMMFPIMLKCTMDLEQVIEQHARKGEPINLHDIAKRYAVDVICSCAFGVEGGCLKNPDSEYVRHAKMVFTTKIVDNLRMAITTSAPVIAKIFRIQLFNPTASNFFRKVVYDTVNYREQNGIERQDFLNLMIRLKNNMSIKDGEERTKTVINDGSEEITMDNVASQCFLFFLAGFETTSATIQFVMYELAKNADIQDKTRENVKETMARNNGELSYESIREMRYLDNVFYETLRKYPTVLMLNRACTADFTIPGTDIVIEKGTKAVLSTLGIHKDPEFYPDPEKFDPNRFTDEEKAKRPAYVYLPFGDGPRICPGLRFGMMEAKLCTASLLLKFKFSLHPKSETIELCSLGNIIGTEEPILIYAEPL